MNPQELLERGLSEEEAAILRGKVIAARARLSGSRSFSAFVQQAWPYTPMCDPLVWGWHMDAICIHLEACARAEINWLGIAMPPGFGKSVFTSVLWPAWIWTWWPKCQFIFGSYSHGFAQRDARRCRDVIQSQWYQETYCGPGGWNLRSDSRAVDKLGNTAGGMRIISSPGGQGAGQRAHVIGIDDPINIGDAKSEAARREALYWISQTLSQRWVIGSAPRFALVMQRLHEQDPMAWVEQQPGAQILRLPTLFEPERACTTTRMVTRTNGKTVVVPVTWSDPRTERDELLFPALKPREAVELAKTQLQGYGFAAQHQQRPAPAEGGLFKLADWRFWKPDAATAERLGYQRTTRPFGCVSAQEYPAQPLNLDEVDEMLVSVDGAGGSETTDGSFTAIHVWARKGARRCLVYRVHRRMDFTDTVRELLDVIARFPKARRRLIEAKASGSSIVNTLVKQHGVTGVEPVNPGKNSKEERAHAELPYMGANNVELPEGAPWLDEYTAEHAVFPNGTHNDDVDAQSQAILGFERTRAASFGTTKWTPPRRTF